MTKCLIFLLYLHRFKVRSDSLPFSFATEDEKGEAGWVRRWDINSRADPETEVTRDLIKRDLRSTTTKVSLSTECLVVVQSQGCLLL